MSETLKETAEQQAPAAVRSSDGFGDVLQIEGFGAVVKIAAVYDRSQPIKCPVCGHLGIRWGGWFTCDRTGDHIVLLETGDVFVRVKPAKAEGTNPERSPVLAPTAGSASTAKPLKSVAWQFPLGGSMAYLFIVASPESEICPDDMDALQEMAALIKRSLERRVEREQVRLFGEQKMPNADISDRAGKDGRA